MTVPRNEFLQAAGPAFTQEYNAFRAGLRNGLGLSSQEAIAVANVHPDVWPPVLVTNLSDECEHLLLLNERTGERVPPAAQLLLSGVVEYDGLPHLDFRRGELTRRLQSLYEATDKASQARFARVSGVCAKFLFAYGVAMGFDSMDAMPKNPQAIVRFDRPGSPRIAFSAAPDEYPIEGPVRSTVVYGPGLTAVQLINEMRGKVDEVHLVSGGISAHFVTTYNRLAHRSLAARASKSPNPSANRIPEAFFYTDGIAASIGEIAAKTGNNSVDVGLMVSVHPAGRAECHAGVAGARRLLRVGGLFAVKAPDISLAGEAGMDVVAPAAEAFFGSPVGSGPCGELAQFVDPGLPDNRPASYAVYRNQ